MLLGLSAEDLYFYLPWREGCVRKRPIFFKLDTGAQLIVEEKSNPISLELVLSISAFIMLIFLKFLYFASKIFFPAVNFHKCLNGLKKKSILTRFYCFKYI